MLSDWFYEKKYFLLIILISLIFGCSNFNTSQEKGRKVVRQDEDFQLFTKLSSNPLDSITLEKIELRSSHNSSRELICILKSNCQLNRSERVHELLLSLTDYNFELKELTDFLSNQGVLIENCINVDTVFKQSFNDHLAENRKRIARDTVCMMIEKMYEIDQLSRRLHRLDKKHYNGPEIDSINLSVIEKWLEDRELTSKRLGHLNEKKLYIMLLHAMRHIGNDKFQKINDALLMLVLKDQFNTNFYVNIIDERLRVNNSAKYPMYNFLRNVKLSEEKAKEVRENCSKINAFK